RGAPLDSETRLRQTDSPMRRFQIRFSATGRSIVPRDVCEALHLKRGDTVEFVLSDGKAWIERQLDLEDVIGSVPALPNTSPDFEREIEEAMEEVLIKKLERQGMLGLRPKSDRST